MGNKNIIVIYNTSADMVSVIRGLRDVKRYTPGIPSAMRLLKTCDQAARQGQGRIIPRLDGWTFVSDASSERGA